MTSLAGLTSLATMRSQRFRASFSRAWAITSSVSAAKPTTSRGRCFFRPATLARISGFSTSPRRGGPDAPFFNFDAPAVSTRQSATAAAAMKMSAGRACSTAASISRAVSTRSVSTPSGSGSVTGPLTRTTSAPASAAARAMA